MPVLFRLEDLFQACNWHPRLGYFTSSLWQLEKVYKPGILFPSETE
jgi:hypothetical protein